MKTLKQAEQPERTDWREQRRPRVLGLHHDGWQQKTIAQVLGISRGYVSQLVKRIKDLPQEHWPAVLKIVKRAGRKPTFTSQHKRDIVALVNWGAASLGLPGQVCTLRTLRQVIHRELCFWSEATFGGRVGKSWLSEMLRVQRHATNPFNRNRHPTSA